MGWSLVAAAAFYALRLNTDLWRFVLGPGVGEEWIPFPTRTQSLATLYAMYVVLGVVSRLFTKNIAGLAALGLLGFTYGLPSDGGRWAWSDTSCCDTIWSQAQYLVDEFYAMPWGYLADLHIAVTLSICVGWCVTHLSIRGVDYFTLRKKCATFAPPSSV